MGGRKKGGFRSAARTSARARVHPLPRAAAALGGVAAGHAVVPSPRNFDDSADAARDPVGAIHAAEVDASTRLRLLFLLGQPALQAAPLAPGEQPDQDD